MASSSSQKPRFPAARLKKMMQSDDDVGRIAPGVMPLVSQSIELFVTDLLQKSAAAATAENESTTKTITAAHLKQCVESEPLFDFLKTTVRATHAPPAKRARTAGGGGARKTATADSTAAAAAGAASVSDVAFAAEHRPLAAEDDDYDADD